MNRFQKVLFQKKKIVDQVPAVSFVLVLVEGFSSFFFVCSAIIVSKFSRNQGKTKPNLSYSPMDNMQNPYYILPNTSVNGK